jgi:glycosyltransferase involved in cell wall biosynthesis
MSKEDRRSPGLDIELERGNDLIEASVAVVPESFAAGTHRSVSGAMPRVFFVDQSGQLGGAEFCLLPVARAVSDRAEVMLLSDGPFRVRLQEENVKVSVSYDAAFKRFDKSKFNASLLLLLPSVIKRIVKLAQRARSYDVLYLNSQKALILGALGRVIHRRPTIWHVHDIVSREHFGRAQLMAIRFAIAVGVDTLIANSHASADAVCKLTGRAPADVPVIHNGVDLTHFSSAPLSPADTALLRDRLGLPRDAFLVGLFGRLAAWKGQHVALRSLALTEGCHLVIVGAALFGEDAYAQELKHLAESLGVQDRVSFVGFQDNVPEWMRAMDAIIHTSTAPEPFGLVLIEAMAARVPLIASRGGAVSEIVRDGETALTVPPSDPEALSKAIRTLMDAPATARRMADAAHEDVMKRFSLSLYTQKIVRTLRRVSQRNG